MECLKRRRSRIFNNKPYLFHYVSFTIFFFFFLSFVSLFSPFTSDATCPVAGIRCPLSDQKADNFYFQVCQQASRSGFSQSLQAPPSLQLSIPEISRLLQLQQVQHQPHCICYKSQPMISCPSLDFEKTRGYDEQMEVSLSMARRFLRGPGSSPPRCSSKCGNCTPCNPVHVAMPPGTPVTTEYYPEAWRCKCGDKLYMP